VVLNERRDRKALKALLREKHGVSLAGEVYEEPLHKQPIFASLASGSLPVSEDYCARHLCLPVFSGMDEADALYIVNVLKDVIS
jgi:dTDP-4-amino-4,6-dideoxygalactose transaminase